MAYLVSKIALLAVLVLVAQTQGTVPQPDPSWDDWKVKSCCPKGFAEVSNYCVQCNYPYVFDAVDQKCKPCPADHTFNNVTKQCDCKVPCELPRVINSNGVCACPADSKGTVMVYNQQLNKCRCPLNLPLWNGKYCVVCPAGTEFDEKQQQCYHCPEGFVRDTKTHSCVPGL